MKSHFVLFVCWTTSLVVARSDRLDPRDFTPSFRVRSLVPRGAGKGQGKPASSKPQTPSAQRGKENVPKGPIPQGSGASGSPKSPVRPSSPASRNRKDTTNRPAPLASQSSRNQSPASSRSSSPASSRSGSPPASPRNRMVVASVRNVKPTVEAKAWMKNPGGKQRPVPDRLMKRPDSHFEVGTQKLSTGITSGPHGHVEAVARGRHVSYSMDLKPGSKGYLKTLYPGHPETTTHFKAEDMNGPQKKVRMPVDFGKGLPSITAGVESGAIGGSSVAAYARNTQKNKYKPLVR